MVDATKRPLQIPQKYIDYLDRHEVHRMVERMYEELLTNTPSDPLAFLVNYFNQEGAKSGGAQNFHRSCDQGEEMDLAMAVAAKTGAMVLSRHETIYDVTESNPDLKQQLQDNGGAVSPDLLAQIILAKTREDECVRCGWVLTGAPDSRDEAARLQAVGVLADHALFVCAEPVTRPPPALYRPPQGPGAERQLFARRVRLMLPDCGPGARVFVTRNGEYDVREDVLQFVGSRGRERASLILRVLLLGLPGSGRRTQAARLVARHGLVLVHCGTLVRAAFKTRSPEGQAIEDAMQSGMPPPEELVLSLVRKRLLADDCRRRGWVLVGYPRTSFQAELLADSDTFPNRTVLLDVPKDECVSRLSSRRFEPASGQVVTLTDGLCLPQEVAARLRRHPRDEPRRLAVDADARVAELRAVVALLEQHVQTVDGTRGEAEVAEAIEKITVFQTPKFLQ
ncbi:LOW QUALITY PROTEIN: adenylate kinase 8-like [Pollicipes pollicipes]|uniref:LOW QUALITY PROTEIN: adenylate kinase 8-like n=1 Tax=Pollicipes pollicipes TaxID=41117 RepID=UPI0018849B0C|nr:LOW QUALITY PROTEIN: adenylate kinase 8-like [Pollicipes pollicipes]